ncbi:MAG: reverse transcriptase domain-containing protein, partial [Anaerolineales bacterium]
CLIRYADDFVCAFEKEEDAQRFYEVLGKRLGKFNLELSADKTQIIPFSANRLTGSSSFNFLGFEFRWGKDQAGKPHVNKRTARKSLRNSLKRFKLRCQENRHRHLPDLFKALNAKLRGYFNYWRPWKLAKSGFVPLPRHSVCLEVSQPPQSAQELQLGRFRQLLSEFGVVKPYLVNRPRRKRRMYVPGLA